MYCGGKYLILNCSYLPAVRNYSTFPHYIVSLSLQFVGLCSLCFLSFHVFTIFVFEVPAWTHRILHVFSHTGFSYFNSKNMLLKGAVYFLITLYTYHLVWAYRFGKNFKKFAFRIFYTSSTEIQHVKTWKNVYIKHGLIFFDVSSF